MKYKAEVEIIFDLEFDDDEEYLLTDQAHDYAMEMIPSEIRERIVYIDIRRVVKKDSSNG